MMAGWCFNGEWINRSREDIPAMLCDLIRAFNERWRIRHFQTEDTSTGHAFGSSLGKSWINPTVGDMASMPYDTLLAEVWKELNAKFYLLTDGYDDSYGEWYYWAPKEGMASPTYIVESPKYINSAGGIGVLLNDITDYTLIFNPEDFQDINHRMDAGYQLMRYQKLLGRMRYLAMVSDATSKAVTDSRGLPWNLRAGGPLQILSPNSAQPETCLFRRDYPAGGSWVESISASAVYSPQMFKPTPYRPLDPYAKYINNFDLRLAEDMQLLGQPLVTHYVRYGNSLATHIVEATCTLGDFVVPVDGGNNWNSGYLRLFPSDGGFWPRDADDHLLLSHQFTLSDVDTLGNNERVYCKIAQIHHYRDVSEYCTYLDDDYVFDSP